MQDTALMLHTLLELGESMLADGADVRRVEQTLTRMGLAYGAVRMDVFVITSSIVLTMCFPDETSVTQTRRIEKSAVTDFGKLEAINAISRSYCEKPFPVQELADRLAERTGVRPTVINPYYITGLDKELLAQLGKTHKTVVTLEDGVAQVLALKEQGMRLKDAAREVAEHTGLSKNELYAAALER